MKHLKYIGMWYALFIAPSCILAMETRKINDALFEAFNNFGLIKPQTQILTAQDPQSSLWTDSEDTITFSQDAYKEEEIFRFAAYWLAASIQNGTRQRVGRSQGLAILGTCGALVPLFTSSDERVRDVSIATFVGLNFLRAPERISQLVKARCDQESFIAACNKLIEKERFQTFATYRAYLDVASHAPLSAEMKKRIMAESALKRSLVLDYYCVIQSTLDHDLVRASLKEKETMKAQAELKRTGTAPHCQLLKQN